MCSEKHSAENIVYLTPVGYDPGVIEITDVPSISGTTYSSVIAKNNEHYFAPNPREELLMDMYAYIKELNNDNVLIPFDFSKTRLNDILMRAQGVL